MAKEIERKFLATIILDELPLKLGRRRQQAYVSFGDPEVRISRLVDNVTTVIEGSYILAMKSGSGLVREEIEVHLPDETGESIFKLTDPNQWIDKIRYDVGGWELDMFMGRHLGLIVAEAELVNENDPLPDVPPFFTLGPEVTYEGVFKNRLLATMTRDEVMFHIRRIMSK